MNEKAREIGKAVIEEFDRVTKNADAMEAAGLTALRLCAEEMLRPTLPGEPYTGLYKDEINGFLADRRAKYAAPKVDKAVEAVLRLPLGKQIPWKIENRETAKAIVAAVRKADGEAKQ